MSTDGLDTTLNTSQVLPYVFPMTTWKRHLSVWGKWGLGKWNDPVLVRTGVWTQVSLAARLLILPTLYTGPCSPGQEVSFQRAAARDTREALGTMQRHRYHYKAAHCCTLPASKWTDSGGLSNGGDAETQCRAAGKSVSCDIRKMGGCALVLLITTHTQ